MHPSAAQQVRGDSRANEHDEFSILVLEALAMALDKYGLKIDTSAAQGGQQNNQQAQPNRNNGAMVTYPAQTNQVKIVDPTLAPPKQD